VVLRECIPVAPFPNAKTSLISIYRPQAEHTELEEELHERAHIDYDRVAIVRLHHPSMAIGDLADCRVDRQPLRTSVIRRCSRLRDRLRHHLHRRPVCLLWCEDWTIALRQADRERGGFREGDLVGACQQAHVSRREYTPISHTSVA